MDSNGWSPKGFVVVLVVMWLTVLSFASCGSIYDEDVGFPEPCCECVEDDVETEHDA